jgi:YD repeat-containing protein
MTFRGNLVLEAVNDAVVEIYRSHRWAFARTTAYYNIVAGQSDYPLPADFVSMAYPPSWNGYQLRELTPDDWYAQLPFFNLQNMTGGPIYCTADANFFRVYPTPTALAVTTAPQIRYTYERNAGGRLTSSNDNASINLPYEFLEAVVAFGKWKLKTLLEYPDADKEYTRFKQVIGFMEATDRQTATQYSMRPNVYGNNTEW